MNSKETTNPPTREQNQASLNPQATQNVSNASSSLPETSMDEIHNIATEQSRLRQDFDSLNPDHRKSGRTAHKIHRSNAATRLPVLRKRLPVAASWDH